MTRVGALLLAAGRSRRMGDRNKLLAPVKGVPMVARCADVALGSRARPVWVVTGHEADRVRSVLAGRRLRFVHNPDFAAGMASSLRAGVAAAAGEVDALLVCLADMPWVESGDLDALIEAFTTSGGASICAPSFEGARGNPVLWPARFFAEIAALGGDRGARRLLEAHADAVRLVPVPHRGVLRDADTPDALDAAGRSRAGAQ